MTVRNPSSILFLYQLLLLWRFDLVVEFGHQALSSLDFVVFPVFLFHCRLGMLDAAPERDVTPGVVDCEFDLGCGDLPAGMGGLFHASCLPRYSRGTRYRGLRFFTGKYFDNDIGLIRRVDQREASPSLERGTDHVVGNVVAATSLFQECRLGCRQARRGGHWRRGSLFFLLLLFRLLFLLNGGGKGSDEQDK